MLRLLLVLLLAPTLASAAAVERAPGGCCSAGGMPAPGAVAPELPTAGQALDASLTRYLGQTPAEGLERLRDAARQPLDSSEAAPAADAALYHLLTNARQLKSSSARLETEMGEEEFSRLKQAAGALADLRKTDKRLKQLSSLDRGPSEALDRLFDATGAAGSLLNGASVRLADGPSYRLDDKTVNDLELYKEKTGLFAHLDRSATEPGSRRLAWMLRRPSLDAQEIAGRQKAVESLAAGSPLRQAVDRSFAGVGAVDGALLEHFSGNGSRFAFGFVNFIHLMLMVMIGGLGALVISGQGAALAGLGQLVMVWLMMGGRPAAELTQLRAQVAPYKIAFQAARELSGPLSSSDSAVLRELGRRLDVDAPSADAALARLALSLRRLNPAGYMRVPDWLWFHGAKTLWSLDRKLKAARPQLADVLGALSELDAYRAMALYGEAHGGKATTPKVLDGAPRLRIDEGHNPYLALNNPKSVANDVLLSMELGGEGRKNFAVLTGSNMGGKSTYLKMGAQLQLLAQTGAPVPAKAMEFTPLAILSSIDIRDNIVEGKSLYDAETDRALSLVHAADKGRHLIVMDEILQGTNPEESTAAQWGMVRYLAKTNNLFMLATHNPKVTELEGVEPGVANYHVEEYYENGQMKFTHRVLPGPAVSRNGLRTLEMKKFPQAILDEAKRVVGAH